MALSNAERQARYWARMKQKASLDGLGQRVRELVERSVETLWTVLRRPGPDGAGWAEADGFATLAEYRRHLAAEPGGLVAACRDLLWAAHLLEEEERRLLEAVVEVADGLTLGNPL